MRIALVLLSLCLAACGGRYIDHSAGLGPQGGPGYKPVTAPSGDDFQIYYSSIFSDHRRQTSESWPIRISRTENGLTFEDQYAAHLDDGQVYGSNSGAFSLGFVKCTDAVQASPCTTVEFAMPVALFRIGGDRVLDMNQVVRWSEHVDAHCKLVGQFEGESSRIWATGPMTSFNLLQIPGGSFEIYAPQSYAELETLSDLAPTSIPDSTFPIVSKDDAAPGYVTFRIPTQLKNGTVITYSGNSYDTRLRDDGHGHFKGLLSFIKANSGLGVQATVDFSCP